MERIREAINYRRRSSVSYEPLDGDHGYSQPPAYTPTFSWLEYAIFLLLGISMLWAWYDPVALLREHLYLLRAGTCS